MKVVMKNSTFLGHVKSDSKEVKRCKEKILTINS